MGGSVAGGSVTGGVVVGVSVTGAVVAGGRVARDVVSGGSASVVSTGAEVSSMVAAVESSRTVVGSTVVDEEADGFVGTLGESEPPQAGNMSRRKDKIYANGLAILFCVSLSFEKSPKRRIIMSPIQPIPKHPSVSKYKIAVLNFRI